MADPRLNFDVTANTDKAEKSLSKFQSLIKKSFGGKDISDPIEKGVNDAVKSYKKLEDAASKSATNQKSVFEKLSNFLSVGLSVKAVDMAVDALKKIPQALGAIVEKGASLQQFRSTLTGLLGDPKQVEALNDELVKFARQTPFNITDMRESAKGLLGVGYAAGDIIPIMTKLGNIAAVVGKERMPSLIEAYTQVTAKGVVNLQQLRRFQTAGVNIYEELEKVLGVSQQRMFQMLRANKVSFEDFDQALQNLTSGTGKYAQGLKSVQDSWYIVTSNIADQAENVFGNIGQVLIEQLTPTIRAFSDSFNKIDAKAFSSKFASEFKLIGDLLDVLYQDMGFLFSLPSKLGSGWTLIYNGFGTMISQMQIKISEFILWTQEKTAKIPFFKGFFTDAAEKTEGNLLKLKSQLSEYQSNYANTILKLKEADDENQRQVEKRAKQRQDAYDKAKNQDKSKLDGKRKLVNDEQEIDEKKKKLTKDQLAAILSFEEEFQYDLINQQTNSLQWSYKTFDKYWTDIREGYKTFLSKFKQDSFSGVPTIDGKPLFTFFPPKEKTTKEIKELKKQIEDASKEGSFLASLFGMDDSHKATSIVSHFSDSIKDSFAGAFKGFGISDILSSGLGAFAGGLVEVAIKAIFGGNSNYKSISDYAQESFDKMVKNTNDALDSIGKEKSAVERKIGILDTIAESGVTTISESVATQLGEPSLAGKTIEQGKNVLRQQQISLSEKEISTAQAGIQSLITERDKLTRERKKWRVLQDELDIAQEGSGLVGDYNWKLREYDVAIGEANKRIASEQLKFNQETYLENLGEMYSLQNQIAPYKSPEEIAAEAEEIERKEENKETLNIRSLQDKLSLAQDIKDKGLTPTTEQYSALGFAPGTPIDTIISSLTGNVTSAISSARYYNPVQKQSDILKYTSPKIDSTISTLNEKLKLANELKEKNLSLTSEQYSALGFSQGTPIDTIINSLTGSVINAISSSSSMTSLEKQSNLLDYIKPNEQSGVVNINISGNVMNIDDTAMSINEALARLAKQGRTI
jgi:tape measure domain-containing protein